MDPIGSHTCYLKLCTCEPVDRCYLLGQNNPPVTRADPSISPPPPRITDSNRWTLKGGTCSRHPVPREYNTENRKIHNTSQINKQSQSFAQMAHGWPLSAAQPDTLFCGLALVFFFLSWHSRSGAFILLGSLFLCQPRVFLIFLLKSNTQETTRN